MLSSYRKSVFFAIISGILFLLSIGIYAQDIESKIDEYINAYVEQDRFSGAVLIAKEGEILVSEGYGFTNREHSILNFPKTKFRLGSVTKQFTAMIIMQLHEQEKLNINDPLTKYIPDYPNGEKITIEYLMSHTAGIPNFTSFSEYTETMMIPTTLDEIISRFKDEPLEFEPGTEFKYSNSGYILLGYIIEKVTGTPYEKVLHEYILEPLGMENTGYDDHRKILKNRAAGYEIDDGVFTNASFIDMSIPHAAGALYSTVEDLYIWDRALYSDKRVSKNSLDKMFTPVKENYGYGWVISEMFGRKVVSHGGGINGFVAHIARYTDDDVCIIILSNLITSPINEINSDLAAIVFGEPYELPVKRIAIELPQEILQKYVGEYKLAENFILTVTIEGNRLFTQATGQPRVEIFPESETQFFLTVVDAQITFVVDDEGEASHLILHQGGQNMPAPRFK